MSIFGDLWRGVTGPFRGIGALIRGKPREAIGDFGDTARIAAPVLGATGVGAPLAAVVGGVGGAASKWGHGESNLGKILGAGAGGAALGATGAALHGPLQGIAGRITGRAVPSVATSATPALSTVTGEEALASAAPQAAGTVAANLAPKAVPSTNDLILAALTKGPTKAELGLKGVEAATNIYGAGQAGKAQQEAFALQQEQQRALEEERARRFRLDQLGMLISGMGQFAPRVSVGA